MKKKSIILLMLILSLAALYAGTLPDGVLTLRGVGNYRKMTSKGGAYTSVNTLYGVGLAFDYDSYFNNHIGLFIDCGLTIPTKSDVDGKAQDFENRDFPVYAQFGLVGRMPANNQIGLDFRFGFGFVYDKAVSQRTSTTIIETRDYYYIIYGNRTISKREYQMVAGVGLYMNLDPDGDMGIRVGAIGAYTFLTGLYEESGSRYVPSKEVADLERIGFEIQPYVGFTFGFSSNDR